jgi:hypothetical protein
MIIFKIKSEARWKLEKIRLIQQEDAENAL